MSQETKEAATEITNIMKSHGFDSPWWGEPWESAMPKIAAFVKWADKELKEEDFVVGVEVKAETDEEREETDEYIKYHYSSQSIAAALTEDMLQKFGPADRLGLGMAVFMTRAQERHGKALVAPCDGNLYVHIETSDGISTKEFKVYEKRLLERLGWKPGKDPTGWYFDLPSPTQDRDLHDRLRLRELFPVLKTYFETDLDQWEMFKMETKHGLVYTTFARSPLDVKEEAFELVAVKSESARPKPFWRVGVERPPMRGIASHDFDSPVSALNLIGKWIKEGAVIRSINIMSQEKDA